MAKGVEIKFNNNDVVYDIYTSFTRNGYYTLYQENFSGNNIYISGSTINNADGVLYVKLATETTEQIVLVKLVSNIPPTPTPTLTPTLTNTPTKTTTPTLTQSQQQSIIVTPTSTPTRTSTPTLTKTLTPTLTTSSSNLFTYNKFVYTSYNSYSTFEPTIGYYSSLTELYNSIMLESSSVSNILETVKTDNSGGIIVGAKVYDSNNTQFNITGYMCYLDNNTPKYVKLINGIITEVGTLTVQSSTVSNTKILFPYYTKVNSDTGWGYLGSDGAYWVHRLNIQNDGLTLIYQFFNGNYDSQINNGGTFNYSSDGHNYICRPYFTINRREKIYGLPNGYKILDMYRGSLIELIVSIEVTETPDPSNKDTQYYERVDNVITNFNSVFQILIGK